MALGRGISDDVAAGKQRSKNIGCETEASNHAIAGLTCRDEVQEREE